MNFFKKALIAILSVGLVTVPAAREVETVEAAGTEIWSVAGTMNGWNAEDTTYTLKYSKSQNRYEIYMEFTVNTEFKIVYNHSWDISIGYGGNTGAGISTYLSDSGGNFKVNTAGEYVIYVKDDNVSKYGDKSYGFGIEEVSKYDVTYSVGNNQFLSNVYEGETLETALPTKEEIKAKGYNVLAWDKDLSTTITGDTEVTATSYYKYFEAKAELGFGYEYDENGEITAVNNMKARFGSDYVSLDSFVGLDISEYGIRLDKSDKISEKPYVKTWKYTSEVVEGEKVDNEVGKFAYNSETKEYNEVKDEEVPTHIRWALTINNIPTSYYTGNFTYECFIVVGGVEYTVSNTRTVSVVSLAETYAGMDGIAEGHKAACQFIVDGKYAVEA